MYQTEDCLYENYTPETDISDAEYREAIRNQPATTHPDAPAKGRA